MQLTVDRERLAYWMKRAGYHNYRDMAYGAKARGLTLSEGTIYKMVEEPTWSATRLQALCDLLGCTPADLIPGWYGGSVPGNGDVRHTHAAPQP